MVSRLTIKELKDFIQDIPDETVVGTMKFNGQTYYKSYVLNNELKYKVGDSVFYIDLGF